MNKVLDIIILGLGLIIVIWVSMFAYQIAMGVVELVFR
jgi:hypothetical protein